MTLRDRINILVQLGGKLADLHDDNFSQLIHKAYLQNTWFATDQIRKSIAAIRDEFLDSIKLHAWIEPYNTSDMLSGKTVGIVMAGNIPLVGFHDLLCSFICGHKTMIKLSSKDEVLLPVIIDMLVDIDERCADLFVQVERLKGYDAVIATGGDTAAVHFEYYFRDYPHIIRKNRNSIAILDGTETAEDLQELGVDIFDYFGLGCRSVSKVYLPRGYELSKLFESIYSFKDVIHHNKYKNNYDYNNATLILTNQEFLTNDFIIFKEDELLGSRIATLHYEFYDDREELLKSLQSRTEELQCISAKQSIDSDLYVPLGHCQRPGLSDYADHVDTIQFLTELS